MQLALARICFTLFYASPRAYLIPEEAAEEGGTVHRIEGHRDDEAAEAEDKGAAHEARVAVRGHAAKVGQAHVVAEGVPAHAAPASATRRGRSAARPRELPSGPPRATGTGGGGGVAGAGSRLLTAAAHATSGATISPVRRNRYEE